MNSRSRASSSTTRTSGPPLFPPGPDRPRTHPARRRPDGGAAALPARAGPLEEHLEVAAPVAAVAARRIERRNATLVGPLADRRLGDTKEFRRLAAGQA